MKFLKNVNNGILIFYTISAAIVLGILTDWYDKQNFFGGMNLAEQYGLIFAVFLVLGAVFLMVLKWLTIYEEQNDVEDRLSVKFLIAAGCTLFYPFAIFKMVQLLIKGKLMYLDEKVIILLGFIWLIGLGVTMSLLSIRTSIDIRERIKRFDMGDATLGAIFLVLLLVKIVPNVMLHSAWVIIMFSIIMIRTVYLFFVVK